MKSNSRIQRLLSLGASLSVLAGAMPAHAQQALPTIDIGAGHTGAGQSGAPHERSAGNGPGRPGRAGGGVGSGAAGIFGSGGSSPPPAPQAVRRDLQPDSVVNAARVSPSSRLHTQTFTREDIENLNPRDTFGLLSNATSVLVSYQGRKFPNNLKFRGDGNFGFVLDGAYVSAQTAGIMMQTFPVSALDQVDVVRDPAALTLGPLVDFGSASGALNSGFVVARTHTPQQTEVEARARIETYDGYRGSFSAGHVFGKEKGEAPGFIYGFFQKSGAQGPNGFYQWDDTVAGMLKGGVTFGPLETTFTFFQQSSRYGFERGKFGEGTASLLASAWSYSPMEATFLSSNSTLHWDEHNTSLLTLAYTKTADTNVLASFTSPTVTYANETGYTGQINARHSFTYGGTLAQIGMQYIDWSSPSGQTNYAGYARKESTLSGYANVEQKLLADRLILDGSVRLDDHFDYIGVDNPGGTTKYFYNRGFPLAVNYAFGATVKPLKSFDFGGFGAALGAFDPTEGLRHIAFTGRYSHAEQSDVSGILPDTGITLLPEKQEKYEAGVLVPLFAWFKPQITYFDVEVKNNKIQSRNIILNNQVTSLWTQSDTSRKGIEAVATGVVQDQFFGRTTYRASYSRTTEAYGHSVTTPDFLNIYPFQSPRTLINFSLTQNWDKFTATVALNHVSMYWSNSFAADGLYHQIGNYTTLDANLAYDFPVMGYDARLTVYGRNIANKRYETILSFPAWGAVWGSELKLYWGAKATPIDPRGLKGPPVAAPEPSPWSGFYAGLNVGGEFGDSYGVATVPGDVYDDPGVKGGRPASFFGRAAASSAASVIPMRSAGFIGGGQLGYNWRLFPKIIGGVEVDLQGTTAESKGAAIGAAIEPTTGALVATSTTATKSLAYLGTARGRIGWLATPTILPYLTAGLAYGEGKLSTSYWQTSPAAAFAQSSGGLAFNSLRLGWAAGAGGEWMFAPGWSAKLEYLRYDLGNEGMYGIFGGANRSVAGQPLHYADSVLSNSRFAGHAVRAGLNHHFTFDGTPLAWR